MSATDLAMLILGAGFLASLLRAAFGPTLADRAVAADICFFSVVAFLALLSLKLSEPILLDAVLVATLLGFVATVALARLVWRGRK